MSLGSEALSGRSQREMRGEPVLAKASRAGDGRWRRWHAGTCGSQRFASPTWFWVIDMTSAKKRCGTIIDRTPPFPVVQSKGADVAKDFLAMLACRNTDRWWSKHRCTPAKKNRAPGILLWQPLGHWLVDVPDALKFAPRTRQRCSAPMQVASPCRNQRS